MSDDCVYCSKLVRPRQEAIQCDKCERWQHRTCSTGISRDQYRQMVRGNLILEWICYVCTAFVSWSSSSPSPPRTSQILVEDTPAPSTQPCSPSSPLLFSSPIVIDASPIVIDASPLCTPDQTPQPAPLPIQPTAPVPSVRPVPRQPASPVPEERPVSSTRPVPVPRQSAVPVPEERPVSSTRPVPVPRQPTPPVPEERPIPAPRQTVKPIPASRRCLQLSPSPLLECPATPPSPASTIPPAEYGNFDIVSEGLLDNFNDISIHDDDVLFEVITKGSRTCKDILVDNRGYTYNLKRAVPKGRDWQCAVRKKSTYCAATVRERGDKFIFGKQPHCHDGEPGIWQAKRITAKVKEDSVGNVFVSAGTIAENVLFSMADADLPTPSRPKLRNLVRIAQRAREQLRPKEPSDCNFEINKSFIPDGFMREDIHHDGQRHILFATDEQLSVLCDLQTWYIDGTFKIVKQPFHQLFSIHGFLTDGDNTKQVPLLFAMMTRRQTSDYIQVFKTVLDLLPRRAAVQTIVSDFEKAEWAAARHAIPGVTVRGCLFHWSQAVWRKVQEVGLQIRYNNENTTYHIIRKLLALPFLPVSEVRRAFFGIQESVAGDERIEELLHYMQRNWIDNNTFPVQSWNVHRITDRTNNDLEGWHRRINHHARDSTPPFYVLIPLLHEEATKLPLQLQMVSEGGLARVQRKSVRDREEKFDRIWQDYEDGILDSGELMAAIAHVNGPART